MTDEQQEPPDLIETLPTPAELHGRLGRALREVELCRRLLKVAERAEVFRAADRRYEAGEVAREA
jgi:hypothetical protein